MPSVLCLENVSKHFKMPDCSESAQVLANLSLDIEEEEFTCILGPSGCGKSTLLNLIAGFIYPTSGKVYFDGAVVTGPGPDRGVVFQDPTLFPWMSVRRNVTFGLQAMGLSRNVRRKKALETLDMVGLNGFHNAYPHQLSGGMRQRVALARVLALEPRALLMDEPFSALDANTRERLQDELLSLWTRAGKKTVKKTILFVTHNVEEAAYLADRVIVLWPAPANAVKDIYIERKGERSRTSAETGATIDLLRNMLAELPCCLPPKGLRSLT